MRKKRMRAAAAILLLGLACCREKKADPKAVLTCMASQHSHDDYLLVTRCEPLWKSERVAGTWFVGFELSLFTEGHLERGDSLSRYHKLIVPAPLDQAVHKEDGTAKDPSAFEIVFIGRQSLLQLKSEPTSFVADKIVSIRRIEAKLPPVH